MLRNTSNLGPLVCLATMSLSGILLAAPAPVVAQSASIAGELVREDSAFSTLVAAAQAAGLVDALAGNGPLTLFAPTNEAFSNLPEGTVESLLQPQNRRQLIRILTYHAVPAQITSFDLEPGTDTTVSTLAGTSLRVQVSDTYNITVNGANVIIADIAASNGVIHAVDAVLLP